MSVLIGKQMRLFRIIPVILFFCILVSCGGGSGGDSRGQCTVAEENTLVYDLLRDFYLWYNEVPAVDPTIFPDSDTLLETLKNPSLDRFSFIVPKTVFDQVIVEGEFLGIGIRFHTEDAEALSLTYVYPGSPADDIGLRRGDRILQVNGHDVSGLTDSGALDDAFGERVAGNEVSFLVDPVAGGENQLLNTSLQTIAIETVPVHKVIDTTTATVGYMVYTDFLSRSQTKLNEVFGDFAEESISELVVDLRYNSGGSVATMAHLASLIAGQGRAGGVVAHLAFNDRYTHLDEIHELTQETQSLDIRRVIFITTDTSCSASEGLINGLEAHVDVVVVGDTTCGKPVGSRPVDFCESTAALINFNVRNGDQFGDYFNGITADCAAEDDISHELGDPEEHSLKSALDFIDHGICEAPVRGLVQKRKARSRSFFQGFRSVHQAW